MPVFDDKTGRRYGNLVVVRFSHRPPRGGNSYWECVCDCGGQKVVQSTHLVSGAIRSCGCLPSGRPARHGHNANGKRSRTYKSWLSMKERVLNPNHVHHARYGGRGISICARWTESFDAFLADMGERPEGMSLDRIDNDGDYEAGNCRWATAKEQAQNRTRVA